MAEHELKTWPAFFQAVESGRKTFQVRRNDRGFQAGDTLLLREHVSNGLRSSSTDYTGRRLRVTVSYVLTGQQFGIMDGFCVMGLEQVIEVLP